uniref:Uncharacterized protein n=1 Tax=Siphoviridae sp. ct0Go27 TaxID=2827761 RepID=A0A8S5RWA8_9CAUD|nr:MAG TPA: hypothetical protein [Siphoviridae sp. ct0Go27]
MNIMIHLTDGNSVEIQNIYQIAQIKDMNMREYTKIGTTEKSFEFLPCQSYCFYGDKTVYVLTEKISYLEASEK